MSQRRYRNNLSNYSAYNNIGTIGFNPVTFNPVTFEPKENDMTLLAQGMARDEQRRDNAFTTYEALNNKLGELTKTFSDDPETKKWFDDNNKRITDIVNQSIQAGDWERAMLDSKRLAGEFVNSREFQDRQRSWVEYNQNLTDVKNRLQNKQIRQNTYDWWVENNKYQFDSATGKYRPLNMPVDDIDWTQFSALAAQMIQPDTSQSSKGHQEQITKPGNTEVDAIYNPRGTATKGGGYQSSNSRSQVTPEQIRKNIDAIIRNIPDGERRLRQDFEVNRWEYEKLVKELDETQRLVNSGQGDVRKLKDLQQQVERENKFWKMNGSTVTDFKEYAANKIAQEAFSTNLAYLRTTSSFSDSDIFSVNEHIPSGATRNNPETGELEIQGADGNWYAPPTQNNRGATSINSAANAANNILNMFPVNLRPVSNSNYVNTPWFNTNGQSQ